MVAKFFELNEKQTSFKTEFIAGLTTFLTMAYIIFVNAGILNDAGMDKQALIAVTCIVSAISTITVGLFANAPISMAPGMGLNAFFAYSLVLGRQIEWQTALGVVFLSGLFFLVLTLLGLRKKLVEAVPTSLISAISVGIGLFITFIGLVNLGVIIDNKETLVSAGRITPNVLIGLAGLLVMIFLEMKKVKGSLLIGIVFSTVLAAIFGDVKRPAELVTVHFNLEVLIFKLDILGALKWSLFGTIFSLMFMDMFDSVGTLMACCNQAGMVDEKGKIKGLDRLLGIDALATMIGALLGTSTTTSYIESAAGIEQGGRSGLTSVITGLLFLLALLFAPLANIVPKYATAPALIMVGLFMMKEVKQIKFTNLEESFPAFIIMVMIALSYSISTGLAFGFISFVVIKSVAGKIKAIKPAMWIIAGLSVFFLATDGISGLIARLKGGEFMEIKITSSAFENEGIIPSKYTCDGENISPPLQWQGVAEGAKSIALICDDPDAPVGTFVHWVVYNLPPDTKELKENFPDDETLPDGTRQGINDFGRTNYGGPCPPSGTHRYYFKIYALDEKIDMTQIADKDSLLKAAEGHVLAKGELIGKYERQ